jgi:membrane protein
LLWGIAAASLNLYFGRFANYASTYGSLGGVIITLMFFYVSGIIFIYGGELNAALLARSAAKAPIKPESRSSEPISALSPQP